MPLMVRVMRLSFSLLNQTFFLFIWIKRKKGVVHEITYHCQAPPTPGDFQELFDKFPTLGEDFMLQAPYILYRVLKNEICWTNTPTLGTNYADKSPPIAQPGVYVGGD